MVTVINKKKKEKDPELLPGETYPGQTEHRKKEPVTKTTTFDSDIRNPVKIKTAEGEEFEISREDYSNLMNKKGVKLTPDIKGFQESERLNLIKSGERQKLKEEADKGAARESLLEEEAKKQGLKKLEIPTAEEELSRITIQENLEKAREGKEFNEFKEEPTTLGEKAAFTGKTLISGAKLGLNVAAAVVDIIKTGIMMQKATSVQQAEATFNDARTALQENIEYVRNGGSLADSLINFELAAVAIGRLEREAKGKGKLNLRYWLDNGRELEAQIQMEKTILNSLRTELLSVAQESRLSRAAAGYGL